MAKTSSQTPSATGKKSKSDSAGSLDRIQDDAQANSKRYLTILLILAIIVAAGLIFWQFFKSSKLEEEVGMYEVLQGALSEQTWEDRAQSLVDIQDKMKGAPQEPWYWVECAISHMHAASQQKTPADMIRYYESAVEACNVVQSEFAKTPWNTLPYRSKAPADLPEGESIPSYVAHIKARCEDQIEWLQPYEGAELTPAKDSNFTAELKFLIDETEHSLTIRTYSEAAPEAVANLKRLAEHFTNTHVIALQQDDMNADTNNAIILGTPYSKMVPDREDLHGNEADWVGFTLPPESPQMPVRRGHVAFGPRVELNQEVGIDPMRLIIYLTDDAQAKPTTTIFGEIEGSEEALTALDNLLPVFEGEGEERAKKMLPSGAGGMRFLVPEKRPKVIGVTTTGTPARSPDRPIESAPVMPAMPEERAPEEKDPDENDTGK